jgi:hypothetical protein
MLSNEFRFEISAADRLSVHQQKHNGFDDVLDYRPSKQRIPTLDGWRAIAILNFRHCGLPL